MGSAEGYLVVRVHALVGARDVVELPAVHLPAPVLEHSVVAVEVLRRQGPGLDVAAAANAGARVKGRATEVRAGVSASASPFSAGAADQVALHGVVGDRAEDVGVFPDLVGVVDGRADAHAVGAVWLFKGEFWRADVLVEGAGGRAAVELAEVRVVDVDEGAGDGSEAHVEVVAVDVAEVVEVGTA